jgi:hypothetical protein
MMDAQQHQIVQIRRTSVRFPFLYVVHVGEDDIRTAGEPAMSVSSPHLAVLGA